MVLLQKCGDYGLSGNAERRIEIPICPICGEKPLFWVLKKNETSEKWFWLFSKEYLDEYSNREQLEKNLSARKERVIRLSDVKMVKCRPNRKLFKTHLFELGHEVFEQVMSLAQVVEMRERK